MLRNPIFLSLSIAIVLVTLVSCTPALPVTQQAMSTANPVLFQTRVAGTSAALMTQTATANSVTPTTSATPTIPPPTETPTPSPTITPHISQSGTSLVELSNGSQQFTDHLAGVQLDIPADWTVVRTNELEYFDAWADATTDPILQHALEGIQNLDPKTYRAHAFNTQTEYVHEEEGSQINFIFQKDDPRSLQEIAENEKEPRLDADYKLIYSGYEERIDGVEVFNIQERWTSTSSTGQPVEIYYWGTIFKVSTGTVTVELFVPMDIKNNVVREFDRMVEQMTFTP